MVLLVPCHAFLMPTVCSCGALLVAVWHHCCGNLAQELPEGSPPQHQHLSAASGPFVRAQKVYSHGPRSSGGHGRAIFTDQNNVCDLAKTAFLNCKSPAVRPTYRAVRTNVSCALHSKPTPVSVRSEYPALCLASQDSNVSQQTN